MLTMIHYVQAVSTPTGVEYHLEHWVSPSAGQHAVKTEEAFTRWLAASRVPRLVFLLPAAACPCGLPPGQLRTGPGRVPPSALARYQRPGPSAFYYVSPRLRDAASL